MVSVVIEDLKRDSVWQVFSGQGLNFCISTSKCSIVARIGQTMFLCPKETLLQRSYILRWRLVHVKVANMTFLWGWILCRVGNRAANGLLKNCSYVNTWAFQRRSQLFLRSDYVQGPVSALWISKLAFSAYCRFQHQAESTMDARRTLPKWTLVNSVNFSDALRISS